MVHVKNRESVLFMYWSLLTNDEWNEKFTKNLEYMLCQV
jgi:hypothetical protein